MNCTVEYADNIPLRLRFMPNYAGTKRYDLMAQAIAIKLIAKGYIRDCFVWDYDSGSIQLTPGCADTLENMKSKADRMQTEITALVERIQEVLAIMEAIEEARKE